MQIPGVVVGRLLGSGSCGTVYEGHHETLDVPVAVKVVPTPNPQEALLEARLMARLDHPNLLRVYDAGLLQDGLYMVLEFMDGGTLHGQHGLASDRLLETARHLLSALQALHAARVLHRDIKPDNCLLRRHDGRVKLADMGLAVTQLPRTGDAPELAGTVPFMAPELFTGSPHPTVRSDLYALGMTLACLALDADPYPSSGAGSRVLVA
ncbi:MAG: serine/threonine-protein kinase [Candidatus Xenobia bacterium]